MADKNVAQRWREQWNWWRFGFGALGALLAEVVPWLRLSVEIDAGLAWRLLLLAAIGGLTAVGWARDTIPACLAAGASWQIILRPHL